jgi:hypothetical protein
MKSLQEILTKNSLSKNNLKEFGQTCREWLIEHGYIYSEVFGWERMEIIEQFKLDPELKGVPSVLCDDMDYKEVMEYEKDAYGQRTGEKVVKRKWFKTGKQYWGAAENYLAYMQFKRDRWAKYDAEDYAKKVNTPPMPEYYNQ